MNPKELFETTMNPAHRKLLRVDLTDAVEAEEMFTKLMAEEVEPRLRGAGQVKLLRHLEIEHDNLRAALERAPCATARVFG